MSNRSQYKPLALCLVLPPFINIYRGSIYFQRRLRKEKKERKDKRGEMETSAFFLFAFEQGRG
jgi:hypothetical protein